MRTMTIRAAAATTPLVFAFMLSGCGLRAVVGGTQDAGFDDAFSVGIDAPSSDAGGVDAPLERTDSGPCRPCPEGFTCNAATGVCIDCTTNADCEGGDVCDTATNRCVECLTGSDCELAGTYCQGQSCVAGCDARSDCTDPLLPGCDVASHNCVVCDADTDCLDPGNPTCDLTLHACVGCGADSDCDTGEVCDLTRNLCVACNTDMDCETNSPSTPVCLEAVHRCVQCEDENATGPDPDCAATPSTPHCGPANRCVECRPEAVTSDCRFGSGLACSPEGTCATTCDAARPCALPNTCCGGLCLNVNSMSTSDVNNCGACGNVCADLAFSAPRCLPRVPTIRPMATCGITCDVGRGDCNPEVADCETDITSSPANCGRCGMACDLAHVDVHTCAASSCGVGTCDAQYGNCDSSDPNGCETLLTSRLRCNSCSNVCANSCNGSSGCLRALDVSHGARGFLALMQDESGNRSVHCAARNDDWSQGVCGNGVGINGCGPVQVSLPVGVQYEQVGAGQLFGCAREASAAAGSGRVWCWGSNSFGQLGNSTAGGIALSPVQVAGITTATHLTVGSEHACVRRADGSVWCWGSNGNGRTGLGMLSGNTAEPMQVTLPGPALRVRAGYEHTCAVLADGRAYCWGAGRSGRLGNGAVADSGTPVLVQAPAGILFSDVQPMHDHTCAIRAGAAGELWCWGSNQHEQLCTSSVTTIRVFPTFTGVSGVLQMVGVFGSSTDKGVTVWSAGDPANPSLSACGAADFLSSGLAFNVTTPTPVAVSGEDDAVREGAITALSEHSLYSRQGIMTATNTGLVHTAGFGPLYQGGVLCSTPTTAYPFRF